MNLPYDRKQKLQGLKQFARSPRNRPNRFFLFLMLAICSAFLPEAKAQLTPQFSKDNGSNSNTYPLSTSSKHFQTFYAPGEIRNATPGNITRIYLQAFAAGTGKYANLKISLGQTTASTFPGLTNNQFFTNLTEVFLDTATTLNAAAANDWVGIDLDSPFLYDPGQTLIVDIQFSAKISGGITVTNSSNGRRLTASTTTAPNGTTSNIWPDFGIDVAATSPCTSPPTAGNAITSVPFVCPNTNFQLNLTGAAVGSDITYQWQSSLDGTNWANISGATSSMLVISQNTTTQYRAVTTCSGNSANSTSVTVVTNPAPMNGTYTVNQLLPFSATGNYPSLNDLTKDLICRGVNGPVTINVVSGTGPYDEQVIISEIPGASASNTVTFNGNSNTVSFTPGSNNRSIFRLDSADYITIHDFNLATIGTSYGWGIQVSNGSDHNVISNNTISIGSTSTSETSSAGIIFTNSNTDLIAGNTGNNNLIIGNTITGGYKGIHLTGTVTGNSNNQIKNNQIMDFYANGITLDAIAGALVEGNDISRPARTSVYSSTSLITLSSGASNNIIARNRLHNTHDAASSLSGAVYPIYFYLNDATTGSENIVKNNLIYNINNTGIVYGIYNYGSDGTFIYHNSLVLEGAHNSQVRGFYQSTAASNIKFNNNLVYLGGSGTGARHAIYLSTATSVVNSENNAFYFDSTLAANTFLGYSVTSFSTLADWKTANNGAFDQNSIYADPQFNNAANGDYSPTNSILNNTTVALAAVTDDITGAPRGTNPDPGAYEFTPVGNDAGIYAIVSPVSPATPGMQQTVQVTIKNYGGGTLTSTVINWSVNGTAQTPFNWSGTLAGGQISAPVSIGNYTFNSSANNLEICTTAPNGTTDSNTANDCFSHTLFACAPLAGTYTIDQHAPASTVNFQSMAAAAQSLNNCGISGAVIFNVVNASGPYNEQVELTSINGSSATNTVTFNGNGNTISYAPTFNNRAIFKLDGTDFVTISNFTIAATDSTYGWGLHFANGADNNTISNNTISILPTNTAESNATGIVFSNLNSSLSIAGNAGNNNIISGNTISGGYKGIHLNGDLTATGNNQIINNTIRDFYYDGIKLNAAINTLIEGNDISRPNLADVNTFAGIKLTGNSQQNVISKNRIHNTHGAATTANALKTDVYGIYFTTSDAPVGGENIVKNNLIYNINNTDVIYGIYNAGSDGAHYFHNSFDLSNANNTGTVRGIYQTLTATNIRFVNNIVSITSSASGNKYGVNFNDTTSGIISNNNVIYVPVGNTGRFGTTDYLTLADWKTAKNNTFDQNSVADNPVFMNTATGNLVPNATSIDNIGQPAAAVTDDINGAPRSTTTPDAGAYEFSVPVDNVGIIAISGPAANCGLSAQESITVTLKNFGTSTQTSIPVTYSVNGVAIAANEIFNGSLAYNATATYTFTTKADLSVNGTYTIVASTMLPGDNNPANDADTLKVTNSLMAAGNITIDFETVATGIDALRTVTYAKSAVKEDTAASFGPGSTKGIIMDGVDHSGWAIPTGVTSPWASNPDNFSGIYMCTIPATATSADSLILSFDLKQLFKGTQSATNFRVTVNGQQIGKTYNPPFAGYPAGTTAPWNHVRINLTAYLNQPSLQIGLESSVKEGYSNGNGTANLLDNIKLEHFRVTTGVKDALAANAIQVYPNPNKGNFRVKLDDLKQAAFIEVYNLAGQLMATENVKAGQQETQMNLQGLAAGTYLLKITSENNLKVTRLIVQ